jgi:hypothetical protein
MGDSPIQLGLVRRVLIEDFSNLVLAGVDRLDDDGVLTLRIKGRGPLSVVVTDPEGVDAALHDSDGTFHNGFRLAFVNENYRLLGLAFGPAKAPSQLEFVVVLDLEDRSLPSDAEQPGWRLFRLQQRD